MPLLSPVPHTISDQSSQSLQRAIFCRERISGAAILSSLGQIMPLDDHCHHSTRSPDILLCIILTDGFLLLIGMGVLFQFYFGN